MWDIEHIVVTKNSETTGEASVKLVDDQETALFLNKIVIDLSNGASVIGIAKISGTPVISGSAVDVIKGEILEVFQNDLRDAEPGMYRVDADGVESI